MNQFTNDDLQRFVDDSFTYLTANLATIQALGALSGATPFLGYLKTLLDIAETLLTSSTSDEITALAVLHGYIAEANHDPAN